MLNVFNIKYTMDRPKFLISNKKEESISALRVNSRSKQQSYLEYKMHRIPRLLELLSQSKFGKYCLDLLVRLARNQG